MDQNRVMEIVKLIRQNMMAAALGRASLVEDLLTALFSRGHVLLDDYPGSGIGQLIYALGKSMEVDAKNNQSAYKKLSCKPRYDLKQMHRDLGFSESVDQRIFRLPRVLFVEDLNLASERFLDELGEAMIGQPMNEGMNQYVSDGGAMMVVATQQGSSDSQRPPLHRRYAKYFLLKHGVRPIPPEEEKRLLLDYHNANAYKQPSARFPIEDIVEAAKHIESHVVVDDTVAEGIVLITQKHLSADPAMDPRGRISTRALAQFVRALKTHAYLSDPRRLAVDWVADVQMLATPVLGHKLVFRQNVAVQPGLVLNDAFERMEETYGKSRWPRVRKQQETIPLTEAAAIYRAFERHLNIKLWGRTDDATPGTIQLLLNAFFADGHILFEDFPGSGKSFMATSMAEMLDDDIREESVDIEAYHRIQCTPDLMPSDITGATMLEGDRQVFKQGPVFAYFLLVDEINRTTPKVQSAFLEAMAEKAVTVEGRTNKLGDLFFVIATQNPLDKAGTFELPAAQLDRFLFKRRLDPIRERYEGRIMLDTALKDVAKEVASCEQSAWGKVLSRFKDDKQPKDEKIEKSKKDKEEAVNRIPVTKIIAAKRAILQNVSIHEDLVERILEVANAIRDLPGDQGQRFFKSGSRPSVRSMQKFINAVKVRAFIDAVSRHPEQTSWNAGEIVACPRHFRELACDLLRHRVVPTKPQDSDKLDEKIKDIVHPIIRE